MNGLLAARAARSTVSTRYVVLIRHDCDCWVLARGRCSLPITDSIPYFFDLGRFRMEYIHVCIYKQQLLDSKPAHIHMFYAAQNL